MGDGTLNRKKYFQDMSTYVTSNNKYIIITLRHYKRSYTAIASKESLMLSIVLTLEVVIFSKNEPALIVLVASLFGNDVLKNTGKNQFTRNKIRESKKL
jgi:hypothetical protein